MAKFRETELKLKAAAAGWQPETTYFDNHPRFNLLETRQHSMRAYYYDTADAALRQNGLAFRVRQEGSRWVATIKDNGSSAGGLHERNEWNIEVDGNNPDLSCFRGTDIAARLKKCTEGKKPQLLFVTAFERRCLLLQSKGGSRIELAIDEGEITAAAKAEAIRELELEIKQGSYGDLFVLGSELAARHPLLPETKSKFYRGLLLAGLAQCHAQNQSKSGQNKARNQSEVCNSTTPVNGKDKNFEKILLADLFAVINALLVYLADGTNRQALNELYQGAARMVEDFDPVSGLIAAKIQSHRLIWQRIRDELSYLLRQISPQNWQENSVIKDMAAGRYTASMLELWGLLI